MPEFDALGSGWAGRAGTQRGDTRRGTLCLDESDERHHEVDNRTIIGVW
jgi:hypothetical protein